MAVCCHHPCVSLRQTTFSSVHFTLIYISSPARLLYFYIFNLQVPGSDLYRPTRGGTDHVSRLTTHDSATKCTTGNPATFCCHLSIAFYSVV